MKAYFSCVFWGALFLLYFAVLLLSFFGGIFLISVAYLWVLQITLVDFTLSLFGLPLDYIDNGYRVLFSALYSVPVVILHVKLSDYFSEKFGHGFVFDYVFKFIDPLENFLEKKLDDSLSEISRQKKARLFINTAIKKILVSENESLKDALLLKEEYIKHLKKKIDLLTKIKEYKNG